MARLPSNGIELEVECLGEEGPPLLLINGLGGQLVRWDPEFCDLLLQHGLRVIRFDNRDVGFSTKLDGFGMDRVQKQLGKAFRGEPAEPAYRLEDMADDVAGLLDALEIESAHVAGASLGGMVAQLVAIRHPRKLRSLVSIMSTTGDRDLPPPSPEALKVLMTVRPDDREGNLAHAVSTARAFAGDEGSFDEAHAHRRAAREYDRCHYPPGAARQLLASTVQTSRREALRGVRAPTLVIHGDRDPLVRPECGVDTQRCVPDSTLHLVRGMGHDLAPFTWGEVADNIAAHVRRAESD